MMFKMIILKLLLILKMFNLYIKYFEYLSSHAVDNTIFGANKCYFFKYPFKGPFFTILILGT